jgi:hypothetical protein
MDNPTAATDRWLMTGTGNLRFAAALRYRQCDSSK